MSEIEVKGKKYKILDDFDYIYVKKFRNIIKKYEAGELNDPDEDMIMLFAEAVCPDLAKSMDKENMAVDGKNLTFGEVKKLVIDLREAFNGIREVQVDNVMNQLKNTSGQTAKNSQEAVKAKV